MKKIILNLLTILTWIYQILCVFSVITGVAMIGIVIFGFSDPDFLAGFRVGFGAHNISNTGLTMLMIEIGIAVVLMSVTQFLICRYARLIVKNIKHEIYFAKKNLQLLKRLLISVAFYTAFSIFDYLVLVFNHTNIDAQARNYLYPYGVSNGLLFLAVLYVVYLVFKYGIRVQEDSDSII